MATQAYVLQLIEDEIAAGISPQLRSIGACHVLAEWIAENCDDLTPVDRQELVGCTAVLLSRVRRTKTRPGKPPLAIASVH